MTQTESIRKHLKNGFSINPLEALNLFRCFRLAARIEELRRDGMRICSEIIIGPAGRRFARYWSPQPKKRRKVSRR